MPGVPQSFSSPGPKAFSSSTRPPTASLLLDMRSKKIPPTLATPSRYSFRLAFNSFSVLSFVHFPNTEMFCNKVTNLLAVPHAGDLGVAHLALELEDAVHEGLGGRGAAGDVDVDGDDAVASADDGVRVVVVAAAVGAGAHGDDPAGLRHLVVDLTQGGSHLVGEGAGDDHHVGLAGGGTENDSETILIVAGGREVHHLDGTAGETEGHGPEGGLTGPIRYYVEGGESILQNTLGAFLANQGHFLALLLDEAGRVRSGGAGVLS